MVDQTLDLTDQKRAGQPVQKWMYPYEWPRLSGRLGYSFPPNWRMDASEDLLQLLPAHCPRGLILWFAVFGLSSIVVAAMTVVTFPAVNKPIVLFTGVGLLVVFILSSAWVYARFARERDAGPFLLVLSKSKKLHLPRANKSISFEQVLRCEIVYGARIRELDGSSTLFPDEISELQLVTAEPDKRIVAWPIIGALGRSDNELLTVACIVARRVNVPCVVTDGKLDNRIV